MPPPTALLRDVAGRTTPRTLVPHDVQRTLQRARALTDAARHRMLRAQALHAAGLALLLGPQAALPAVLCDHARLLDAEAAAADAAVPLGLSQEDRSEYQSTAREQLAAIQRALIPAVEERLRVQCDELAAFFHVDEGAPAPQASQLASECEALQARLEQDRAHCELERDKLHAQMQQLREIVQKDVRVLADALLSVCADKRLEQHREMTRYLGARLRTMRLKQAVLQHEVLVDTYTPDKVAALGILRNKLDLRKEELRLELARTEQRLHDYQTVGPEFEALVQEYATVQDEINNKRWALEQLR